MENSTVMNINGLLWEVKYSITTHPTERNFNGDPLIVKKFDMRKKRVPSSERCCGLSANGQQCTRRKKEGQDKYCGTHIKGTPHGTR